ncbi:hypothetical protein VB264_22040 [Arcicella aquatica]|uniref:Uncharacterized protein n=1 Tax=Arcicella aquatica TaxID=217141 RepID=A0ABU5QV07_9BACT|nr:hypothetical protein [Arcicella aquatica]MEA5260494.1 hypothetical protein [Arcicella aquatica]
MKSIKLIFVLNILFFFAGNAQKKLSTCEDVSLKGYIINQYKESEIIASKNTSIHMIDFYYKSYFIPIQNSLINDKTIDSLNVINYKEGLYFFPNANTDEFISKFCGNLKKESNFIRAKKGLNSFFQIVNRKDEFLYKFEYYECEAIKTSIPNTAINSFLLNIPYNKNYDNLICFFIYRDVIKEEIKEIANEKFLKVK